MPAPAVTLSWLGMQACRRSNALAQVCTSPTQVRHGATSNSCHLRSLFDGLHCFNSEGQTHAWRLVVFASVAEKPLADQPTARVWLMMLGSLSRRSAKWK